MSTTRQLQIVLIFAFITRLLLFYFFPLHMTDYMLINSAAQNLIDGHGMGFIRSSHEDLSAFYFEGLRLWPPLVTALTALCLKFTESHPLTDFLMMTLVLIGFISVLYHLCKEIGLNKKFSVYIFLVFALNPELIKRPGFSDITSAFFCTWALLFLITQLKRDKMASTKLLLFGSLLFFLPSAFRYQYYPVSILFPLYLIASSMFLKDKKFRKRSVYSLMLVLLLLLFQETYLAVYTAQPINQAVAMDKTGFFLFNLQNSYPFFFKTFINISYLENTWNNILRSIRYYYYSVSVVLIICLLAYIIRLLLSRIQNRRETENESNLRQTLSVMSLIPFLILPVFTLIALSLTHNSRTGLPGGWTYVNEGRYYIIPSILLLLLTFWLVQNKWSNFSSITKQILTVLFVTTLIYNLSLTVKFGYNSITNNIPDKERSNRLDRASVNNFIQGFASDSIPTVITYTEPYFTYFPYIKNVAVTQKIELLQSKKLITKKKVRLLIIAQKEISAEELAFVKRYKAKPHLYRSNCIVYSSIIEPE